MTEEIDYGPLKKLAGVWKGNKGLDVAPDPDGTEENPYHETITFTPIGNVKNAEKQVLAVVRYHQVVQRKSNDEVFHDEIGYWMWDAQSNYIMHSVSIPRGVCVLAGAVYKDEMSAEGNSIIEVSASQDDKEWQIIQSPFMENNAKTIAFNRRLEIGNDKMKYSQTTMVEIYGKTFEHTDENELTLQ